MLVFSAVLFFIGAVFLCLDINIEGFGVLAAAGLAFVVVSAVLVIISAPVFGVYIVLGMVIGLIIAMVVVWNVFKVTKLKKKIMLEDTLAEDIDDKAELPKYIGKQGVTKTTLRPCGFVSFGAEDIEAYSDGPYIKENTPVIALRVSGRKLFVKAKV